MGKWENGKTGTSLSADSVRSCTAVPGSSAHARAQPGSSPVLDARLGIELRYGLARLGIEPVSCDDVEGLARLGIEPVSVATGR